MRGETDRERQEREMRERLAEEARKRGAVLGEDLKPWRQPERDNAADD